MTHQDHTKDIAGRRRMNLLPSMWRQLGLLIRKNVPATQDDMRVYDTSSENGARRRGDD